MQVDKKITFIDIEVTSNNKIVDIGAVNESVFHSASLTDFVNFISESDYLCGHNIIHFDLAHINKQVNNKITKRAIDTLYLSPLLFPKRPYHSLLKDDKLRTDELNNPVNDCKKAKQLFDDEVSAFNKLSLKFKQLYYSLLHLSVEFSAFFYYLDFSPWFINTENLIKELFKDKICENVNLKEIIDKNPVELAYTLSIINTEDKQSITPAWLLHNYPQIENIYKLLRNTPCEKGCDYCDGNMNVDKALKNIFGYDSFRSYNGVPLQKMAASAAVSGKSLLAIFPTGGGKSITFQIPAIMAGISMHGLTVVISPLQSLMKDQVDNLEKSGISEAVTINGLLNPIERAKAIERVLDGSVSLLYISPEQLRSKTIERILQKRYIARFVIDEAHCFSAWGHDFRVDYLFIGEFIRTLQELKKVQIPVSCFTATAKQKVISDICDYFRKELNQELELFASDAERENLHYNVLYKETKTDKYNATRNLILSKNCSTIVYVSRTASTIEIANKLCSDGIRALPYNGKMDSSKKVENQEAFINDEVKVIVATSAFGMGVDKKDVKLVIHYDISDSLENYIQEAGRAGRDNSLEAECYILYNDSDLDGHFILLNQSKLSLSEIQQIWRAIKELSRNRNKFCASALEIARTAGWDENVIDIETRVKAAISTLERAGYVKRGHNVPHIYATSVNVKNVIGANEIIENSSVLSDVKKTYAKRIINSLISKKNIAKAGNADAESRVDYLADILGIDKRDVIDTINNLIQIGVLADHTDMSAYILKNDSQNKSLRILEEYIKLEKFLLNKLKNNENEFAWKQINENASQNNIKSSVKNIKIIVNYWTLEKYIKKDTLYGRDYKIIVPEYDFDVLSNKYNLRIDISKFIIKYLYEKQNNNTETIENPKNEENTKNTSDEVLVQFSLNELYDKYRISSSKEIQLKDIENALLYLSKINAMILEGGFLVSYNGLEISRLIKDNRIQYKKSDYNELNEYYKQKIQQIHIVGEYANLMVKSYDTALEFVRDYFQLEYKKFISKYFVGERADEISRNITVDKYNKLFSGLSDIQKNIIDDNESKNIVVAAGPGSGKTKVLVHKLASILQLEDVKHEQLLMLTFSRAAAMEFKNRLYDLIGKSATYLDIKTFHSCCFDILGNIGTIEKSSDVVKKATNMIYNKGAEQGKITKSVVVIDEAQDMNKDEFELLEALMSINDDMRIIAVGDDDQNIYSFRGSDSIYFERLHTEYGAKIYELTENFRSRKDIVEFSNRFVKKINRRMKITDSIGMTDERGMVHITYHSSKNLEIPTVHELIETYNGDSSCILTRTNEESLKVYGLLKKYGKKSRLIQTIEGFSLIDLMEIRYIISLIEELAEGPIILDEDWTRIRDKFTNNYCDSLCYDNCNNILEEFEKLNIKKYKSDFLEFVNESNYEDFYLKEDGIIYVSTIHKSKGREFDNVYMMLDTAPLRTDEDKRAVYVALTRAKQNLFIHCNTKIFQDIITNEIAVSEDRKTYNEPQELLLQLTHKDIFLDYCKDKKDIIASLKSGKKVTISGDLVYTNVNGIDCVIAKLSRRCRELFKALSEKGYAIKNGELQFIVRWKAKEDIDYCLIPLINVNAIKVLSK